MRALLPTLALLLVFTWPLLTGHVVGFDPMYYNVRYPLSQGQLFWNPYAYGGSPVWGDLQNAVLYPFTLPFYLTDPQIAMSLSLSFHLFLAAFGTYFLARTMRLGPQASSLAAVAFTLGFWPVFHLGILSMNSVLAWFPWILAAARRFLDTGEAKWWVALTLLSALQWLAGHPQPTVYCGLAVVAMGLTYRRRLPALLAALALGLLISGLQTWPGLLVASRGLRSQGLSAQAQNSYALTPRMLATAVSPYAWGGESEGGTPGLLWRWLGSPRSPFTGDWGIEEVCVYPGLSTWLLVALALLARSRTAGWLSAGVVFCLTFAMGASPWLLKVLPGAQMLRTPSRITLLACLALALLAGLGLETPRNLKRLLGSVLLLALLHLAAPAPAGWVNHLPLVFLALTAVGVWVRRPTLVVLAVGLDLLITAQGYVVTYPYPYQDARVPHAALVRLAGQAGSERALLGTSASIPGTIVNWSTPYHVASLQGWNPMAPRGPVLALYLNEAGRFPQGQAEFDRLAVGNFLFAVTHPATPLTELLGARFVLQADPDGLVHILENPRALPRAWVPVHTVVVADPETGLRDVLEGRVDPHTTLFAPVALPAAPGTVTALTESWDTVQAEVEMAGQGTLATNLFLDPGWSVRVDGAPAVVQPANGVLMAVEVPPGHHVVQWRYLPDGLGVGALLTLVGLLGLGVGAYRPRPNPPPIN